MRVINSQRSEDSKSHGIVNDNLYISEKSCQSHGVDSFTKGSHVQMRLSSKKIRTFRTECLSAWKLTAVNKYADIISHSHKIYVIYGCNDDEHSSCGSSAINRRYSVECSRLIVFLLWHKSIDGIPLKQSCSCRSKVGCRSIPFEDELIFKTEISYIYIYIYICTTSMFDRI